MDTVAPAMLARGYRVIDFAADMKLFLEDVVGQPAIVLGHSLGGLVGIALAAASPTLVCGLIIEDAPLWLRRTSVREGSERAYRFFKQLHDLLNETQDESQLASLIPTRLPAVYQREGPSLAGRLAQLDREVLRMSFDSSLMDEFDIDASLAEVRCPTLLLQADTASGGSLADEDAAAAVDLLPQGTHRLVQGSGHLIHGDRPVEMARHIRDWLSRSQTP